jgi:hypothetical protein
MKLTDILQWVNNNIAKAIAIAGSATAIIGFIGHSYVTYLEAKRVVDTYKQQEELVDRLRKQVNILMSPVRAELDHNKWNRKIEHSNGGDAWYFITEEVYGKEFKMVYPAIHNKKENKYFYLDLNNKHHWIEKYDSRSEERSR